MATPPPGQCGLASLGEYDSPPPGHVNSLVPMFLRTNAHAYANLSYAAARIADLHHKLEYLASRASSIQDTQPGVLSPEMRDLVVEANEEITNASIIQCGMTGAVRLPDPVVMFLTTKKNPSGSDCGKEVAQPLLEELDAVLEGDATDLASLGAKFHAFWSRIKECGLLLSLTKLQGVRGPKLPPHLMGVLASFREQLFMALVKAPMQVMRRENFTQYALPDCLEAIVRMHNLGPSRALEIASDMGCSCLLPGSLEPILPDFRQMSGGGLCTYTNIKSKIKANETTLDAIQAHERIVKKQAKPLKLPHEPKPKVRSLYKHEAQELSEIKVKSTEKSRERTKESLEEGPVLFVRTCKKRKTTVSSRTGYGYEESQQRAAIALQMFRGITGQPLDKDAIATALSGTFALPFLLTERVARPLTGCEELKERMDHMIEERLKTEGSMSAMLEGISYDEVAGWEDVQADPVFDIGQNFSETDFASLDFAAAQAAANTFI